MGRLTVNGLDGIIDDLAELVTGKTARQRNYRHSPCGSGAEVIVQAQRTEIESRWKGPHSLGISEKSVKKGKVKMGGILPPALPQTRRTPKRKTRLIDAGEKVYHDYLDSKK